MRSQLSFIIFLLAYLTGLVISPGQAGAQTKYRAIEVITSSVFNPTRTIAGLNINDKAEIPVTVIGYDEQEKPFSHAGYVDRHGVLQDVHVWGSSHQSFAFSMNNRGQVSGFLERAGQLQPDIFRYSPGRGMEVFGLPFPQTSGYWFVTMNGQGGILGNAIIPNVSGWVGFCIGCPNVRTSTTHTFYSINDKWQILALDFRGDSLYLIQKDGAIENITDLLISTDWWPFRYIVPRQINNRGSIIAETNNILRPLVFIDGRDRQRYVIPSLAASACTSSFGTLVALNNLDQVVGYGSGADCRGRAFVWDKIQGARDLSSMIDPPLPNPLWDVIAINDQGEILLHEYSSYSEPDRYYLLQPIY